MSKPVCNQIRCLLFIVILFLSLFFSSGLYSQSDYSAEGWLPKNLNIDLSSDGKLGLSKKDPGFALNEFRLRSTLTLKNNNRFVSVVKSKVRPGNKWHQFDERLTQLTQLYFQYGDNFKLPQGNLTVNAQIGKLEWYPSFTDPRQIIDNIDLYLNPPNYYGGNLFLDYYIFPEYSFSGHLRATSGDVINDNEKASIKDAYFRFTPEIIKDFGARIQFGKIQGTKYLFNEAYLYFTPLLHDIVRLDLRAGKLPGIDKTPYGGRIGIEGRFKYVAIGGYYEHRIDQHKKERIFGFYWRILEPEELVNIFNTFQILYDTNNDVIRFNVPFFNVNIY